MVGGASLATHGGGDSQRYLRAQAEPARPSPLSHHSPRRQCDVEQRQPRISRKHQRALSTSWRLRCGSFVRRGFICYAFPERMLMISTSPAFHLRKDYLFSPSSLWVITQIDFYYLSGGFGTPMSQDTPPPFHSGYAPSYPPPPGPPQNACVVVMFRLQAYGR